MKKALINTLLSLMEQQDNIYVFTGDLGFGVMDPIIKQYPERFFNLGICEQNMASVAAGMALSGNIVYIYSIGNFPTFRCMEQIRNDITYHNANVKIIAVGSGFSYGSLGMSHHLTEDLGAMRALDNLTILSPCDAEETGECIKYANNINGPVYIRLGRGGEESTGQTSAKVQDNKVKRILEGEDKVIFATGSIVNEVKAAAERIKALGGDIGVYSVPVIKPIDLDSVKEICQKAQNVYTVEEHNVTGGLGSAVAEILADYNISCTFKRMGIRGYTEIVGSPEYLRKYYRLDADSIIEEVLRKD